MSYQVVRIEQFTKSSLGKIGCETERTSKRHRNEDIDGERTPLNLYFKKSEGGLPAQWNRMMKDLNITFREKKDSTAFEGMIITSDAAFFERLGWKKGEETPHTVTEFFNRCYEFALREIGYHCTDKNGITIDEILVLIPQLSARKNKLARMKDKLPKVREQMRTNSSILDYKYLNYDVNEVAAEYEKAADMLAKAQNALDVVNMSKTLEITL